MRTKIKTIHEESIKNNEVNNRIIGVLENYSIDDDQYKESFIYTFTNNSYIIFNTIFEMIEFVFMGDKKIKRAYMEEEKFEELYDADYLEGKFIDYLDLIDN